MRNPRKDILKKIKLEKWTNHNIRLTSSEYTISGSEKGIEEDPRVIALKNQIPIFWKGDYQRLRVVDLGCLEGGISLEMAKMGFHVLGVEGRRSNYSRASLIEQYFDLPNLEFVEADVKHIGKDRIGSFDIILCCGLLYHLDDPFSFLETLSGLLNKPGMVFLDTHFAPLDHTLSQCTFNHELSDMVKSEFVNRVYEGRWYSEDTEHAWAAVSNTRSFWPTHKDLIKGIYHSGFEFIYEIFGSLEIEEEYLLKEKLSRSFLLALKQ